MQQRCSNPALTSQSAWPVRCLSFPPLQKAFKRLKWKTSIESAEYFSSLREKTQEIVTERCFSLVELCGIKLPGVVTAAVTAAFITSFVPSNAPHSFTCSAPEPGSLLLRQHTALMPLNPVTGITASPRTWSPTSRPASPHQPARRFVFQTTFSLHNPPSSRYFGHSPHF